MDNNFRTVLLVEDDHDAAELLACFLAAANLRPVIASNGVEGLQQARALQPSVILCDSSMPGLEGTEVIGRLRADVTTAHIPVILMSGHDDARFDRCGADAFVPKPFDFGELIPIVKGFAAAQRRNVTDSRLPSAFQNTSSHSQCVCSGLSA